MTTFNPRWYQVEAVQSLWDYFERANGNPLISLPTGSGKSLVIAMFLASVMQAYPNQRIVVATHVKELVGNNYETLREYWPSAPAGIFSAGMNRKDIYAPITFAGVASIVNAIELFGWIDLLIVDEAHLIGSDVDGQYMRLIAALMRVNPKLKVIGLTATVWRTGMGPLTNGEIFTDVAYDICNISGFRRLFSDYHLVPLRVKPSDTFFDNSGVRFNGSDYSAKGLQEVTKDKEITWKALNESLNKNQDRNCRLVFCTGVDHAVLADEMLRAIGLRSAFVHSKMSPGARDDVINAYKAGELDVLTNNGIYTTGHNNRAIDHIIQLRKTASVGLHVQMNGRGMRTFEFEGYRKTDCMVSDHVGNARDLGPIDDPFIPKMKGAAVGDMPVKLCEACGTYNHARATQCEWCGEPFAAPIGYKVDTYSAPLITSELPAIETFRVDSCYYTQYLKRNATPQTKPCIKATYKCGLHTWIEYVFIESDKPGLAHKARDWWKKRFPQEGFVPKSVAEAMQFVDRLIPPKAVRVHVNKEYPTIEGYEY